MDNISSRDSLNAYQKKMAHNRRVISQAQAILKRAKKAGIPPKFMRIKKAEFRDLLDDYYHKDVDKLANYIYDSPLDILKKEIIVIDGGGIIERQKALFAILFRLIACDKYGYCWKNNELAHDLSTFNDNAEGYSRSDITHHLKKVDVAAISEIRAEEFKENLDSGRYYDDFLAHRDDYVKTTILSFFKALPSRIVEEDKTSPWTNVGRFGQYICLAGQSEKSKQPNFFRIKVKKTG